MRSARLSRTVSLLIIGQVVVTLVLAWLTNLLVERSVAQVREAGISREAAQDFRIVEAEIASAEKNVLGLRSKVTQSSFIHIPSAPELRDLASRHRLRIRKMERQTRSAQAATTGNDTYSIVCVGGLNDQVEFLRELETVFLLQSDNLVLQRYNDDGSLLALGLTLEMREP